MEGGGQFMNSTDYGVMKNWPGWVRLWSVASFIVPFWTIPPVLARFTIGPGEIAAVVFSLFIGTSAALMFTFWLFSRVVRILAWVAAGFTQSGKTAVKLAVIAAAGLSVAFWMRYDIVAVTGAQDYYLYLIWDRWTGKATTSWSNCSNPKPVDQI
jgi:hypothetical protein